MRVGVEGEVGDEGSVEGGGGNEGRCGGGRRGRWEMRVDVEGREGEREMGDTGKGGDEGRDVNERSHIYC